MQFPCCRKYAMAIAILFSFGEKKLLFRCMDKLSWAAMP
jgi:hypothetical protein